MANLDPIFPHLTDLFGRVKNLIELGFRPFQNLNKPKITEHKRHKKIVLVKSCYKPRFLQCNYLKQIANLFPGKYNLTI